ncbi:hypothetical protein HCY47_07700 [Limosilactobacillus fermentum]
MMKKIMNNAWKIAKNAAKKFGGKAIEYIGGALKMAWEAAKGLTEKQIGSLVSKGYNRWTTDDGERDRLYLNIYKHNGMFHYGKWNGEDIFPAEQRAIKAVKVWIDVKTGEVAFQATQVNRYVDSYKQLLINAVKADLTSIN